MKVRHIFIFIFASLLGTLGITSLTAMQKQTPLKRKASIDASDTKTTHSKIMSSSIRRLEQHFDEKKVLLPLWVIVQANLASNDQENFAEELLDYINNPEFYKTKNPTCHNLAQKWISNATSRIFPDNKQFLTEIIANACDASVEPENAIGKLGLGFFSIFNNLKHGSDIKIKTSYYDADNKLKSYSMVFENINNHQINVLFDFTKGPNKYISGTTVFIRKTNNIYFPDDYLAQLLESIYKSLHFYSHFPIHLIQSDCLGQIRNNLIINKSLRNSSAPIKVALSPVEIRVQDNGRGIPLWTALQELLVPCNTKNKVINHQNNESVAQAPQVTESLSNSSRFFITSRGKTIICKKLPTPLLNNNNKILNLHLELPAWIKTSLAHNEIIMSQDGKSNEEIFIKRAIQETIQKTISGNLGHEQVLYALYQGLEAWEKESSSAYIKDRFSKYLQDLLNQALESGRIFAAPLEFIPLYNKMFKKDNDGITLIPIHPNLVYNNYEPLEEHLMQLGRTQLSTPSKNQIKLFKQMGAAGRLIFGLYVFCAPMITQTSHLGLRSCIFVPEKIFSGMKSEQELTNALLHALPQKCYQATTRVKSIQTQTLTLEQDHIYKSFCDQYYHIFKQFEISPDSLLYSNSFAYSWTENITRPLTSLFANKQAIATLLMQDSLSFNMLQLILESLKTSPETYQQMKSLQGTHLGGYTNLFNIGQQSLPHVYGQSAQTIFHTFNGLATHQCGIIAPLIYILDKEKDHVLLQKIINLQKKDFLEKVSSLNRDNLLSAYKFHIPGTLSGTPLFFLGALAAKTNYSTQSKELIKTIINEIKKPEELAFITTMLLSFSDNTLNHVLTQAGLETLKAIIYHHIQKVDPVIIKKFYSRLQLGNYEKIQNIVSLTTQEPTCKSIEQAFEKLVQGQSAVTQVNSMLPPELTSQSHNIPKSKLFTLSQLLKAHCQNNNFSNILDRGNLEEIFEQIQRFSSEKIKKIEQSIEAGSERDDITATIIEALQNSIDASREVYNNLNVIDDNQKNDLATIDITLERLSAHNPGNQAIKITLHDNAGFSSVKTLLTNFILPDLSDKSAAAGSIGEMGNGSFKMYQNAQIVYVLTRTIKDPNLCYLLSIKPIRSQDSNLVEDLELACIDVSYLVPSHFKGTSLSITLQEESSIATEINLANALDFLHNYVGGTTAHLASWIPFKIFLHIGNKSIHLNESTSNNLVDIFTYAHSPGKISVFKRNQENFSSIISTAGIPFCSFDTFVREQNLLPESFIKRLEKGYIIDFSPGTYEPVQSRTKLQLKIPINELRKNFLDIFYKDGLEEAILEQLLLELGSCISDTSFLAHNFTHFFSRCSIYQLVPSFNDQENFNKELNIFLNHGIWNHNALEVKFFDFYKDPRVSKFSFSEYLRQIYFLLEKQEGQYFNNQLKTLIDEHQQDINALHLASTEQEKIVILNTLKIKFQERILQNMPYDQHIRASLRRQVVTDWDQYQSFFLIPGSTINGEKQGLFKTIVMNWINKKMHHGNYSYNPEDVAQSFIENLASNLGISLLNTHHTGIKTNCHKANNIINALDEINTLFCKEYLSVLGHHNPGKPISCFFSNKLDKNELGHYEPKNNTIVLSHTTVSFVDMMNLLQAIIDFDTQKDLIDTIENLPPFKIMYQPIIGKVSTLIHELEHARRYHVFNQNPGQSGCENHDDGYDPAGNHVNFDACAQSWAECAFSQGLIQRWIEKTKDYLHQNKELAVLITKIVKEPFHQENEKITATLKSISSLQSNTVQNGIRSILPKVIPNIVLEEVPIFKSERELETFLSAGNDINKQYSAKKSTMLHSAVIEKLPSYVEFLLKHQADTNLQDNNGNTPLHALFLEKYRTSSIRIAELLIIHQTNLNIANTYGDTPFHIAIRQTSGLYTPLLERMQNADIQNTKTGKTLLHVLSEIPSDKSDRALTILLSKGANIAIPDSEGNLPLHYAAENKGVDFIQKLLEANKAPTLNAQNKKGETPLFFALRSNNVEVIKFLIEQGAHTDTLDFAGNTIVHNALDYGVPITKNTFDYILKNMKNDLFNTPNNNGQLPAHLVPCDISQTIFKLIINKTKDLNYQDKEGNTLLHSFLNKSTLKKDIQNKNFEYLVNRLKKRNKSLGIRNGFGRTAQDCDKKQVFSDFWKSENLISVCNDYHNTPLHWAAEKGFFGYVSTHIQSGKYEVNNTRDGLSALHLAAYHGHLNSVKVLLDLKADIDLTDSWGQTALHWAANGGHQEVFEYLLACGANPEIQDHLKRKPCIARKNIIQK